MEVAQPGPHRRHAPPPLPVLQPTTDLGSEELRRNLRYFSIQSFEGSCLARAVDHYELLILGPGHGGGDGPPVSPSASSGYHQ